MFSHLGNNFLSDVPFLSVCSFNWPCLSLPELINLMSWACKRLTIDFRIWPYSPYLGSPDFHLHYLLVRGDDGLLFFQCLWMSLAPKVDVVWKSLEKQFLHFMLTRDCGAGVQSVTTNEPTPTLKGEHLSFHDCSLLSQWRLPMAFVARALELGAGLRPDGQQIGYKTIWLLPAMIGLDHGSCRWASRFYPFSIWRSGWLLNFFP